MCLANIEEYRIYFLNEMRKLETGQDEPEPHQCERDPIAEAIEIECGALLETVAKGNVQ